MGRLEDIARSLYAVPLAQFTAERNAAARDAPSADDARAIRAFRKPSAAASAVNALVRSDPGFVASLVEVATGLQLAQASIDRDAIREFSRRRQQVLADAKLLLADLTPTVSGSTLREVEETLQAAMIDEDALAAVQSGYLVRALESTGLDPVQLGDAVAIPVVGERREVPDLRAGAARRIREDREAATLARAERALEALKAAATELEAESVRLRDLEAERGRLSEQLDATEKALADARSRVRDLDHRHRDLEREAASAHKALASLSRAPGEP